MRYHITPNGPSRCRAKTEDSCPYGRAGEPHYDNIEEASAAYDAKLKATFNTFDTIKKNTGRKTKETVYKASERTVDGVKTARDFAIDRMIASGKAVKASAPVQKTVSALRKIKEKAASLKQKIKDKKDRFVAHLDRLVDEQSVKGMIAEERREAKRAQKFEMRMKEEAFRSHYRRISEQQKYEYRAQRQALRNEVRSRRVSNPNSFKNRLKASAEYQKKSWQALRGVNSAIAQENNDVVTTGRHAAAANSQQTRLHEMLHAVSTAQQGQSVWSRPTTPADMFSDLQDTSGLREYAKSL